jgi:uncharacterized protein (TIGR00251 family)
VLAVRVVPRAGRSAVVGPRGGALLVRVAAAPVDNAANDALVAFLATILQVPKRQVALIGGERSRDKRVHIAGLQASDIAARLQGAV